MNNVHSVYVAQFSFHSSRDLVQDKMVWMVYQDGLDLRLDYFLFLMTPRVLFYKYN